MTENVEKPGAKVKVHIASDLDYKFRDVANVYVGQGEVVFEFGNHHRSMPGNVTISNRVVMTFADAYDLQQRLQKSLHQAQQQMQEQFKQQQEKGNSP